jgi:hypothetical protein
VSYDTSPAHWSDPSSTGISGRFHAVVVDGYAHSKVGLVAIASAAKPGEAGRHHPA